MSDEERFSRIESRLDGVETGLAVLRTEMNARFDEVPTRAEMHDGFAELRRHAAILFEKAQDQISALGEGLNARLDKTVGDLRSEMRSSFAELKSLITVSYRDLDRRVSTLEAGRKRPR